MVDLTNEEAKTAASVAVEVIKNVSSTIPPMDQCHFNIYKSNNDQNWYCVVQGEGVAEVVMIPDFTPLGVDGESIIARLWLLAVAQIQG